LELAWRPWPEFAIEFTAAGCFCSRRTFHCPFNRQGLIAMLTYLALLANDMLSLGELWPSVTVHPGEAKAFVTPAEQSTLALGLIGAATVGLYVAVNGFRRPRGAAELGPMPSRSARPRSKDTQARPTREAA
jgi:hypothetical protein